MGYAGFAMDPASNMERNHIVGQSIGAETVDIPDTELVDITNFEFCAAVCTMGAGDTAVDIDFGFSATDVGSAAVTDAALQVEFAAIDDNKSVVREIRLHGREQFMNITAVGTGGAGSIIHVELLLIGPKDTARMTHKAAGTVFGVLAAASSTLD